MRSKARHAAQLERVILAARGREACWVQGLVQLPDAFEAFAKAAGDRDVIADDQLMPSRGTHSR
jgi:hypothetical protein